eukprot:m51a1_g8759 hypothetical protein (137) ;mRNA; f:110483-111205
MSKCHSCHALRQEVAELIMEKQQMCEQVAREREAHERERRALTSANTELMHANVKFQQALADTQSCYTSCLSEREHAFTRAIRAESELASVKPAAAVVPQSVSKSKKKKKKVPKSELASLRRDATTFLSGITTDPQ